MAGRLQKPNTRWFWANEGGGSGLWQTGAEALPDDSFLFWRGRPAWLARAPPRSAVRKLDERQVHSGFVTCAERGGGVRRCLCSKKHASRPLLAPPPALPRSCGRHHRWRGRLRHGDCGGRRYAFGSLALRNSKRREEWEAKTPWGYGVGSAARTMRINACVTEHIGPAWRGPAPPSASTPTRPHHNFLPR